MRRLLILLLLLVALPASAGLFDKPADKGFAVVQPSKGDFLPVAEAFRLSVEDSDSQQVKLRFINADGYYLYQHRFSFKVEPADSGVSVGEVKLPPGKQHHDEYFGDTVVYYAITDIDVPLNNPQHKPFTLVVNYQGCADQGLCYAPETIRLQIADGQEASVVSAAAASAAAKPAASAGNPLASLLGDHEPGKIKKLGRALVIFFLLGLALTFTPCVLPMLPILSGVVLRGRPGGLRGLTLSLAYVLPMALCYAVLGTLMGLFGAKLNLQAMLQSPWVLIPFATFFVVFAIAMFGMFEMRLPAFIRERLDNMANNTRGGSIAGAATLGVLSSLLVSPCVTAPLAGLLLYISSTGDAAGGGMLLFSLGLGMGTPLVIFAVGGGALLPKSGAWMNGVRNVFGVMLLAVAIWMLERLVAGPVALTLWGTLAGGVALALGTLELGPKRTLQRAGQLIGLMFLVYAVAAWTGALRGESDPMHPLGRSSPGLHAGPPTTTPGDWQNITTPAQLNAALASAQAAGRPVLLDWYADWCISCKIIERQVLPTPEVQAQLPGFVLLRFDMTASTEEQRALLDRYNLFGPPALLFFSPKGDEWSDLRIIGETDSATLAERLKQAGSRS
ncbi:protein-disulfide reductase DsbD [Pseudomonas sp. ZM23]|uniref:Thiol:disulfide interchange protein DsbD n=1 Tax=Pseudomonas triclosanedens TaxID=2961893 RepID=A0ABY6ZVM4_9PSED|nr:protein-disulfide reductase DsbD [Pseudomonas triclosanedens]MCP8465296.1 protein-disulfide reductase DsbD [Pseudomonas triclosanedens]MCP8470764.1 protein-disulfide reductase DsbD [Pseudomonas triclosanedens]MCP8476545.1 protein-disulfide reductase DsbD [Pseudomonas triclosanedens]WAI48949.1 protein-disulfide reductase DsbD [Pseudomonas triclosanedens]